MSQLFVASLLRNFAQRHLKLKREVLHELAMRLQLNTDHNLAPLAAHNLTSPIKLLHLHFLC